MRKSKFNQARSTESIALPKLDKISPSKSIGNLLKTDRLKKNQMIMNEIRPV